MPLRPLHQSPAHHKFLSKARPLHASWSPLIQKLVLESESASLICSIIPNIKPAKIKFWLLKNRGWLALWVRQSTSQKEKFICTTGETLDEPLSQLLDERILRVKFTWVLRVCRTDPRLTGFKRDKKGPSSVPAYLSDFFSEQSRIHYNVLGTCMWWIPKKLPLPGRIPEP